MTPTDRPTCAWAASAPEYLAYHDDEWGRPLHGVAPLFERLSLEGFQSGLSWLVILRKRERFREVFAGFDPQVVATYDERDVQRLPQQVMGEPQRRPRRAPQDPGLERKAEAFVDLVRDNLQDGLKARIDSFHGEGLRCPSGPSSNLTRRERRQLPLQSGCFRLRLVKPPP